MKFSTIEAASEALGVSVRQGWRYLKKGVIHKSAGGFTITDMPDNGTMTSNKPISSRKMSVKNTGSDNLRHELLASRLEFEIEKSQAVRAAWHKRQDAERKADHERQASLEAQKLRLASEAKEKSKLEKKMQRVKAAILPETLRAALPAEVRAQIIHEIARLAPDADFLSLEDLITIAEAARDKVIKKNYNIVMQAFSDYGRGLMVEKAKQLYQDLRVLAAK